MGIPKTGVFGLYDLIGIDLMADVLKSFIKELPNTDEFHKVAKEIINSEHVRGAKMWEIDKKSIKTDDSVYSCTECGQTFGTKQALGGHMALKHKIKDEIRLSFI